MKRNQWIYWISTGLLSAFMLFQSGAYLFKYEAVSEAFRALGYPSYLIYPLAIAKILGLLAIWTNYSRSLKEWAYAGFFFDFVLAFAAHRGVGDGEYIPSIVALILLIVSYRYWKITEEGLGS